LNILGNRKISLQKYKQIFLSMTFHIISRPNRNHLPFMIKPLSINCLQKQHLTWQIMKFFLLDWILLIETIQSHQKKPRMHHVSLSFCSFRFVLLIIVLSFFTHVSWLLAFFKNICLSICVNTCVYLHEYYDLIIFKFKREIIYSIDDICYGLTKTKEKKNMNDRYLPRRSE